MNPYARFAAMVATSTAVMYILMYLTTYRWNHVYFSETRLYMGLLMGAAMALVMFGYMANMYTNRKVNLGIVAGSLLVFIVCLWLARSQATVGDNSWMRAMIPHHSIAILTSDRAKLSDPRVQALADRIIKSQREEIEEMKTLLRDLEKNKGGTDTTLP